MTQWVLGLNKIKNSRGASAAVTLGASALPLPSAENHGSTAPWYPRHTAPEHVMNPCYTGARWPCAIEPEQRSTRAPVDHGHNEPRI